MSNATIKLVNGELLFQFYFSKNPVELARKLLGEGYYKVAAEIAVDGDAEDAAEECFDLTNNPSREQEREQVYGRFRSVSVGDIVSVGGDDWLCCSQGWCKV